MLSAAAAAAQGPQAPPAAAPGPAQPPVAPPPGAATAPRRVGYLAPGTAPDVRRVLAPPPVEGDSRDAADLTVFRNTRRLQGTPRWAMALRDNALGTPALLQAFSCALDSVIAPAEAPALVRLLSQSNFDAGGSSVVGKNTWRRKRPYEREAGAVCLSAEEVERLTRSSPDYPSGHATAGWMAGRLLAAGGTRSRHRDSGARAHVRREPRRVRRAPRDGGGSRTPHRRRRARGAARRAGLPGRPGPGTRGGLAAARQG